MKNIFSYPAKEIDRALVGFRFTTKLLIFIPLLIGLVTIVTLLQQDARQQSLAASGRYTVSYESLYLSPLSSTIRVGQTIPVELKLKTMKRINAAEIAISYPDQYFEISSITINNQSFDVTVTNNYGGGQVHLELGSTKPLTGDIKIATITLKGLQKSQSRLMFNSPTNVLSFDTNTNISVNTINGKYNIR